MGIETCSVDGCDSPRYVRGWCIKHHARWKRHGDPTVEPNFKGQCSVDGCERIVLARGWCNKHYSRWKRHGDPQAILTARHETEPRHGDVEWNFWSHVEKTEACWKWLGSLSKGYGKFKHPRRNAPLQAHRFAYELIYGDVPDEMDLDHICHNRQCVNPSHLRIVTAKQNLENHSGPTRRSTTGVRGVFWREDIGKWTASVGQNNEIVHVGVFGSIEDAEAAVIAKRNELHTHNDADRV